MYVSFQRDPLFLTRFHRASFFTVFAVDMILWVLAPPDFSLFLVALPGILLFSSTEVFRVALGAVYFIGLTAYFGEVTSWAMVFVALMIPWTLLATSILHNASHGNFRPRWLGRLLGEFVGLAQLVGFPDWTIVHVMHHANPDHPEKDPHPPLDKGYWAYLSGMRLSILRVLLTEYYAKHGKNPSTDSAVKQLALYARGNQIAKIVFWFLVLPLEFFSFFFATSIVFKMMHYAWFNWTTHIDAQNGGTIKNKQSGVYALVNAMSFGLYYHQNHHLQPKLFNPSVYESNFGALEEKKVA